VLCQLTASDPREQREEARRIHRLQPRKLVLKIPCTTQNISLMADLTFNGAMTCAATAVFTAGQAYLACEAGARYLIPYVNRITASGADGPGFVTRIAAIARSVGKGTEILAASLKTPDEVAQTILAGAHHVTLPLAVIQALGNDQRSDEAIAEFARSAKGM
jgi:transaldolase